MNAPAPEDVTASVRAIVGARVLLNRVGPAHDDAPLGSAGLGLDSIAIAEVVLDCERRFGVRLLNLLDGAPLTIARIAARLRQRPGP